MTVPEWSAHWSCPILRKRCPAATSRFLMHVNRGRIENAQHHGCKKTSRSEHGRCAVIEDRNFWKARNGLCGSGLRY